MTVEGVDGVHFLAEDRPQAVVQPLGDPVAAEDLGHALDDLRRE